MHAEKKDEKCCPNCGKIFTPLIKKQQWCCRKCSDAYRHRARRRLEKCVSNEERERLRISFYEDRIEIKRYERRQYPKIFEKGTGLYKSGALNNVLKIPLCGRGYGKFAIVDDTPFNRKIVQQKFSLDHYGYPMASEETLQHLHHLVFGWPPKGYVVDHINRDPLDCRSCNLRFVTKGENNFNKKERVDNSSGKTGVYFDKKTGRWYSRIGKNKQTYNLGCYGSFRDAVAARERAEIELYGYKLHGLSDNKHTRVLPASVNRGIHEKSRLKGSKRSGRRKKR